MRTERRDPVAAASRAGQRRNGPFECFAAGRDGRADGGRAGGRADERTDGRTDGCDTKCPSVFSFSLLGLALRGWQDEAGGVAAGRVGGAAGRRDELRRVSCRCKKTITAIVLPRSACAWVSLCAPARQHRCEGSLAGPATHKQGSHARCSGDLRTYSWDIPGCVRICVGMYAGCAWDVRGMYAGCTRDVRGICVRSRVRCA